MQSNSKIKMFVLGLCFSFMLIGCVSQTESNNFAKQPAAQARLELAMGYLQQNDFSSAKLNLDKALSYAPDYYLVHSLLAYFYQQQGNLEQAEKSYLTALALDGKQGDVQNNFAAFLCSQGKFDAAYFHFNQALNSPNYYAQGDTYENLILCSISAKQREHIPRYLSALEKIDPQRAEKLKHLIK